MEEENNEEKLRMGFLQRWKMKKTLKHSKRKLEETKSIYEELQKKVGEFTHDEEEKLALRKEEMLIAILGDKEKGLEGLIQIFEVTEDGKPITKEVLEEASMDDIIDLFEDLLNSLELHI